MILQYDDLMITNEIINIFCMHILQVLSIFLDCQLLVVVKRMVEIFVGSIDPQCITFIPDYLHLLQNLPTEKLYLHIHLYSIHM